MKVFNWTPGNISVADLADISLQFAAKIPAGVTVQLYAEPVGGSTANRANLGTLTGSGIWQTSAFEFAQASNVEAFRTALNTGTARGLQTDRLPTTSRLAAAIHTSVRSARSGITPMGAMAGARMSASAFHRAHSRVRCCN